MIGYFKYILREQNISEDMYTFQNISDLTDALEQWIIRFDEDEHE